MMFLNSLLIKKNIEEIALNSEKSTLILESLQTSRSKHQSKTGRILNLIKDIAIQQDNLKASSSEMFITTINPYKSDHRHLPSGTELPVKRSQNNLKEFAGANEYNPMIKLKSSSLLKLIKSKTKRDLTEIREKYRQEDYYKSLIDRREKLKKDKLIQKIFQAKKTQKSLDKDLDFANNTIISQVVRSNSPLKSQKLDNSIIFKSLDRKDFKLKSESKSIDSGKPLNCIKEYQDNDTAFNYKSNAIKNLKIRIQNRIHRTNECLEKHDQQTSPFNLDSCKAKHSLSESKSRKVIFTNFYSHKVNKDKKLPKIKINAEIFPKLQ